jgi:hypothetical protein
MAGLLSDVLPWVYSRGNAAKRALGGLLSDPAGTAQQAGGLLNDKAREHEALQAQAFADPKRPFRVTDQRALGGVVDNMMAGPMGFAPVGMTKAPRADALETARKNAVKMLGLPENNTPIDRARAMGFTTEGFRGSSVDEAAPRSTTWWSEDPGYANAYAAHMVRPPKGQPDPYAGNVMPLLVRMKGAEPFQDGYNFAGVPQAKDGKLLLSSGGRETGYRTGADGKVLEGLTRTENVRSRFAAFDPARMNERDMLGSITPEMLAILGIGSIGTAAALEK